MAHCFGLFLQVNRKSNVKSFLVMKSGWTEVMKLLLFYQQSIFKLAILTAVSLFFLFLNMNENNVFFLFSSRFIIYCDGQNFI